MKHNSKRPPGMKWERLRELVPGSDVLLNLEYLQAQAIELRARLVSPFEPGSLHALMGKGDSELTEWEKYRITEEFRLFAEQKCHVLGEARVTRILLSNLPNSLGFPLAQDVSANGVPERWASGVLVNIEHELDLIDQKRSLWMTAFSAFCAAVAAIVGAGALIVGLITLQKMH